MTNGAEHRLDVNSVQFCLGDRCTTTLRVDREDADRFADREGGARFEFSTSEIDYLDGPSTKVVWTDGPCTDPRNNRDRFYIKTHGCETSDFYVYYLCNPNFFQLDFFIRGTDPNTDEMLDLKLKNIERADFP
jgi:hypothetical protein